MFEKIGFLPADIMLPKKADMTKYSVIACDQYTSQPEYWNEVEEFTKNSVSTYNLVFPEIYLAEDNSKKIGSINSSMKKYLDDDIFNTFENSFVLVEREIKGKIRYGLVGKIDLEQYDYSRDAKVLVRATEGTVTERIPPRVKIRENAPLELPHVMLLIDDKDDLVFSSVTKGEVLYDFDLMQNAGHIKGYKVTPTKEIADAFNTLLEKGGKEPMLFAVGDGNHSLATAKACYTKVKEELGEKAKNHPARYALVEVVNIHSTALEFEPIHRVMFNVEPKAVIDALESYYDTTYEKDNCYQEITYCYKDVIKTIYIKNPSNELAVGTLQKFIDDYLNKNDGVVDYIHGDDVTISLAKQDNAIGFILKGMEKSDLFKGVTKDGPLPRKTFSMGEAFEKRFYLEARKIK